MASMAQIYPPHILIASLAGLIAAVCTWARQAEAGSRSSELRRPHELVVNAQAGQRTS